MNEHDKLFKRDYNKVMSLLLKYSHNEKQLRKRIEDIFSLIKDHFDVDDERKHLIVSTFVWYILLSTHIKLEELSNTVRNVTPRGGEPRTFLKKPARLFTSKALEKGAG